MHVLGISCYFHDSAAALRARRRADRGRRGGALQPRRSTTSGSRCRPSSSACRGRGSAARSSTSSSSSRSRSLKFERILLTALQTFPRSRAVFQESMIGWLTDKLWIKGRLVQQLRGARVEDRLQRPPPFPRGERVLLLAVRGGGDPHRRRRRRVGHRDLRGGRRDRHRDHPGDPLPALDRPALQRLHRVPRLRGQRGRVQGHGHGPVRQAPLRRRRVEADPPGARRQLPARHELLLLPPLRGPDLQPEVRRPVRGAPRRQGDVLHRRQRATRHISATTRRTTTAQARSNQHYADLAASIQKVTEEVVLTHGPAGPPGDRALAPLHGRRRRAQQRGQRPASARDAVRGAVHPARGGRRRRRARRGAVRLPHDPRQAARAS